MKSLRFPGIFIMAFMLVSFPACDDGLDPGPAQGGGQGENPDVEQPGGGDSEDEEDGDDPETADYSVASVAELEALADVPAGTVIEWKNGTYDDAAIRLSWTGTEDAPVVFRAETPGGVTFTGASSLWVTGSHIDIEGFRWSDPEPSGEHLVRFQSGSSYCVLSDCEIDGSGSPFRGEGTTFKWVSLHGTGHAVTHCNFNEKRDMGALLVVWLDEGVPAWHTISYNRFARTETIYEPGSDPDDPEPANEQEIMRIGDSSSSMQEAGCIVEHNFFYHCNGERAEIVSNKSCGNIYRNNAFYESCGTLTLRHGNGCLVSGNYFYGSDIEDTGGVRIIGENHTVENNVFERLNSVGYKAALCICAGQENPELSGYWQVRNATVRGNTFIDCNLAMHVNYGSSNMVLPVVSTVVEDNVAVTPDGDGYVVRYEDDTVSPAEISWSGNTFYGRFRNNYFNLSSVGTRPAVDSCLDDIERVAAESGPSWL